MSMSLGLHQLNVGMPLTVRDMYKHGEKALYLIKVGVFHMCVFLFDTDNI